MKDQLKRFLNEEQDPKSVEKILSKLEGILMKNEEIGYIGVQKKPAITVLPESIILTNKRIILCKPKNLGLSLEFTDYNWRDVASTLVKENILGSEFSFSTQTGISIFIDYIPKIQARKLHTFAQEQLEIYRESTIPKVNNSIESSNDKEEILVEQSTISNEYKEDLTNKLPHLTQTEIDKLDEISTELSKEDLITKLQNFKKLLDQGLILQSEYDSYKNKILELL